MKKVMVLISILGVVSFQGCSAHQFWYGENKPAKSYAELPSKATLFVWNPKNNAAVINSNGKSCIQGADVFHEKSGNVDLSKELLSIVQSISLSTTASSSDKALAVEIKNDIMQLKTNTERNTYLSLGMFGLCQLNANGGLSNTELLQLIGQLIETSAIIGNSTTVIPTKNVITAEEPKK